MPVSSSVKQGQLPNRITVLDRDTMRTVAEYKQRKGHKTWAESLDKLVASAAALGLHKRDVDPSSLNHSV